MGERSKKVDCELSSDQQEKALALLAAKGDGDAFRRLLEHHYDMMFRVAYRFCGHREEAEDIAQDVCVSLPKRLKSFNGDAAFSTWLYRVVVNACKDASRKKVTRQRLYSDYAEVDMLRREAAHDEHIQMEWLRNTMMDLPEDLRDVAVLVVGEGMSHAQAADVMNVKEGTISWRVSELKKALRRLAEETA